MVILECRTPSNELNEAPLRSLRDILLVQDSLHYGFSYFLTKRALRFKELGFFARNFDIRQHNEILNSI